MNIFRVFSTILYPLFVYVLLSSRRNLVESSDAWGGSSPTPGSGIDLSNKTGVELSLKATAETDQFNYNKTGRVITYTPKDNYGFKSVKTGDKVVWSTDNSSEYATKVVLNGKGQRKKEVTIHLPNNTTKVFNRGGKRKQWTEVIQQSNQATDQPSSGGAFGSYPSGPMTGDGHGSTDPEDDEEDKVEVEDEKDEENEGEEEEEEDGSSAVEEDEEDNEEGEEEDSQGGGESSPPADGGSDDTSSGEGTETADGSADKGAGEGTEKGGEGGDGSSQPTEGSQSSGDGSTVKLDQDGTATPPPNSGGDGTPNSQTNNLMEQFEKLVGKKLEPDKYPQDIKLFKADPNDANNIVELTKSEYKIKQLGDENLCVFDHGVNCTLIKHNDKEVWQYDSSKADAKHPKGMNVEKELLFIYFDGYTKVYSNRSGEWNPSSTVKKDLSQLKMRVQSKDPDRK